MKILLLNGPPGSGKDTAAQVISEWAWENTLAPAIHFDRMSMPIKRAFAATFVANIDEFGNVEGWEDRKDQPDLEYLNGKSYRDWQIDYSEKFMKPLYGGNIFPWLLANRLKHSDPQAYESLVLIPDLGFQVELDELSGMLSRLGIYHEIGVLRMHRQGTSFRGDSRSYLEYPTRQADILNDFDKGHLLSAVLEVLTEWRFI